MEGESTSQLAWARRDKIPSTLINGGIMDLLSIYLKELALRGYSPNTIRNYRVVLNKFIATVGKPIQEVTTLDIKSYILSLKGRKGSYINNVIKRIKLLFRYLYEEELIERDVASKIKLVREETPIIATFERDEIKLLVNAYDNSCFLEARNKTVLMLLADCGLRANEVCNLKTSNIYDNYILIENSKGNKSRVVPLSLSVRKQLIKYEKFRRESEWLFTSVRNKQLTTQTIEVLMREACKRVGIPIRSPHKLRHSYAQSQLLADVDIYTISKVLGHNSINTTNIYLRSLDSSKLLNKSISILDNL